MKYLNRNWSFLWVFLHEVMKEDDRINKFDMMEDENVPFEEMDIEEEYHELNIDVDNVIVVRLQ